MTYQEINKELGNIDLYLLDQVLKGAYQPEMKILDAGCGEGRNLFWFLKNNYQVWGIDSNPSAILMLQYIAKSLNPALSKEHFSVCPVENMPFEDHFFDALISNAVLHFAQDETHFFHMIAEMHRVLKPGGQLFIRMTSDFAGMDALAIKNDKNLFSLPDGSIRFLLTETLLDKLLKDFQFEFTEPLKTVNVDNQRAMSTLILRKLK